MLIAYQRILPDLTMAPRATTDIRCFKFDNKRLCSDLSSVEVEHNNTVRRPRIFFGWGKNLQKNLKRGRAVSLTRDLERRRQLTIWQSVSHTLVTIRLSEWNQTSPKCSIRSLYAVKTFWYAYLQLTVPEDILQLAHISALIRHHERHCQIRCYVLCEEISSKCRSKRRSIRYQKFKSRHACVT